MIEARVESGSGEVHVPGGVGSGPDDRVKLLVEVDGYAPAHLDIPRLDLGSRCDLDLSDLQSGGRVQGPGPCTLVASRGSGFRGVISGEGVEVLVPAGATVSVTLEVPAWDGYGDVGFKLHPEDSQVFFIDERCLSGQEAPRVGDEIVAVAGRSASIMSREELVRALTGPIGGSVEVEFSDRRQTFRYCSPK